jgi:hypothetical protein
MPSLLQRLSVPGTMAAHLPKCRHHHTLFCRINPEANVTLFQPRCGAPEIYDRNIYLGIAS